VIDVPAKLSARVRASTPATPARPDRSTRTPPRRHCTHQSSKVLSFDEELVALRLLVDRRDELSPLLVQTVNRLHRLLAELIPDGAARDVSATKATRLLAGVVRGRFAAKGRSSTWPPRPS
jgi:hypothetical protein